MMLLVRFSLMPIINGKRSKILFGTKRVLRRFLVRLIIHVLQILQDFLGYKSVVDYITNATGEWFIK